MIAHAKAAGWLLALVLCAGCAHRTSDMDKARSGFNGAATRDLSLPSYDSDVLAVCDPPIDWKPDPLKSSSSHTHQVWLSPTGLTAYGVIHFKLPFPVGADLALWGFMEEMKKSTGDADLESHQYDDSIQGIRFIAEGGPYQIRAFLVVDGWEGWVVYAGTLRGKPVIDDELEKATRARDRTGLGRIEK